MKKLIKAKIEKEIAKEMRRRGYNVNERFVREVIDFGYRNIRTVMGMTGQYKGRVMIVAPSLMQYVRMWKKKEKRMERAGYFGNYKPVEGKLTVEKAVEIFEALKNMEE